MIPGIVVAENEGDKVHCLVATAQVGEVSCEASDTKSFVSSVQSKECVVCSLHVDHVVCACWPGKRVTESRQTRQQIFSRCLVTVRQR